MSAKKLPRSYRIEEHLHIGRFGDEPVDLKSSLLAICSLEKYIVGLFSGVNKRRVLQEADNAAHYLGIHTISRILKVV
jgi:hypothetical protein